MDFQEYPSFLLALAQSLCFQHLLQQSANSDAQQINQVVQQSLQP